MHNPNYDIQLKFVSHLEQSEEFVQDKQLSIQGVQLLKILKNKAFLPVSKIKIKGFIADMRNALLY